MSKSNEMHFCFATQTRRDGEDCRDCRGAVAEASYVLVIKDKALAFGPFATRDDAEYMAMDYYGTAITGASIRDEFLIAELRSGGGAPDRQREGHVAALMASDA
ncbi:MAG TPA: hypothetical protein VLE97_11220 [Gaiellaceae bacterium]|nr:hypothetical protein [Gaiellaceae bacterium]